MTTNLTLPQDNAVIDYSIISQMIAAINQQQADIDSLKGVNTVGGGSGAAPAIKVTIGGQAGPSSGSSAQTFQVNIPAGMSTITSGVAMALSSASKPVYTWVSGLNSKQSVTFSTSAAVTRIYYILTGTV